MANKVFYSWQSDLPRESTSSAIRIAIKEALIKLEENDHFFLDLDEATSREAGSPEIPSTIFKKISNADIFVCDISTINSSFKGKKTPNPNVLIELGYAISVLGWERIIMLFNRGFGDFPNDCPFDLEKRRITPFLIKDRKDKNKKIDLTNKLHVAIKQIIECAPKKQQIDNSNKKRNNDIKWLKEILSNIHIETFDKTIDYLPDRLLQSSFFYKDVCYEIYENSRFYIYDKKLRKLLETLFKNWGSLYSYAQHYGPSGTEKYYKFYIPFDVFPSKEAEKDYNEIMLQKENVKNYFIDILNYLREEYLEIDIDSLSANALEKYEADLLL